MIMKRSKLDIKIGFIPFLMLVCALFVASCDTFETDPDLQVPEVELEGGELVVMTNGSTFIDLTTQIKSNVPINFSITSPVQNGLLTDLGGGLLQYQPTRGLEKGRDSFVFSAFSENNQFITKDTIVIVIENNSILFPCGVYTADDYVYGFSADSSVTIDVLANDIICSIDSLDVRVSIHRPAKSFPPYFGTASVVDNKIVYTAGASFRNADKVVYKIESLRDAAIVSYGLVYITSENPCWPVATNDFFVIDSLATIADSVFIPAFDNDQLCMPIGNSQVSISSQPNFGSVTIATRGFLYTAPETLIAIENFTDSFTYQLCDGNRCTFGQVTIYWPGIPDSTCTIKAVMDSIDLSGNSISPIDLDVLFNDVICDSLKTFKITTLPTNGTATIQGSIITYERNFNKPDNDKLEYIICDELGCSSAKVFIKRE
jgi:Bacterial Ig domain